MNLPVLTYRRFCTRSCLSSLLWQQEPRENSFFTRQTPPPPPGWKKTIQDLFAEATKTRSAVGPPEVEWARDYERSLIPAGTRFPKKGDVFEATKDVEVRYLTSWLAPSTGGGSGTLKKGERVIINFEPLPRPIAANATAINYSHVEEGMVPESDRSNKKYAGFYLVLKTLELSRDFKLVHEEPKPAEYQGDP
jgi:hypothetical protein